MQKSFSIAACRYIGVFVCACSTASVIAAETTESVQVPPSETQGAFPAPLPVGVPSLQMSTDYASPSTYIGGYRPAGQVPSEGIRIEPFTIRGGLHTGLGYDDNVALSQTNKISSVFLSVSPSVAVGLEGAIQRYYLIYRGNYGRYFSSSVDDYADHNVSLSAANDWTTRLRSLVQYEYLRGHDPRGSTTANLVQPESWDVNALRGSVSYGAAGAQGRLEGNVAYSAKKYQDARPAGVARDYDQIELGGTFLYRLAPKTQGLVEVRRAELRHTLDPLLDSSETRYLVGATWEATAKTTGAIRVGYMVKDPENPVVSTFSAPTYEATVTWLPLTYSRLALNARRTFNEPLEVGSSFIIDNFLSATWTHAWTSAIQSVAAYAYGQQRHQGLGRTDTYHTLDFKVSYALHRKLRVGAEYRHDTRDSAVPTLEFKRNLTLFTVEAAL